MLAARLWLAGDDALTDAMWLERARTITSQVLPAAPSAQVIASLNSAGSLNHVDGGIKLDRTLADGAGYSMAVVRTPRDGLGSSMSLVFRHL
jgi:hypothetical protein